MPPSPATGCRAARCAPSSAPPNRPLIVASFGERARRLCAGRAAQGWPSAARLYSLAVDPAHGAARASGAPCCRPASATRAPMARSTLRLEVRYDNAAAIALYESLGFRQFGHYEGYYADGARGAALREAPRPAGAAVSGLRRGKNRLATRRRRLHSARSRRIVAHHARALDTCDSPASRPSIFALRSAREPIGRMIGIRFVEPAPRRASARAGAGRR